MRPSIPLLIVLFAAPGAAFATPPEEVLDALDKGLNALSDPEVVQSYQLSTAGSYEKLNGESRSTFRSITKIIPGPDGQVTTETIMAEHDGEDVTEKGKERESKHGKDDDDGEHGSVSFELTPPCGDDLASYEYGESVAEGARMRANFTPKETASGKGLAHGTVWWDPATGKPTKLQFVPVKNPQFIQTLSTMLFFGSTGGLAHISRVVSSGQGGIPGFKRKFALEMVFDQVLPAG